MIRETTLGGIVANAATRGSILRPSTADAQKSKIPSSLVDAYDSSSIAQKVDVKTAKLPGRLRSPKVVLSPAALAGQLANGELAVRIPLVDNASLGLVTVRPGTVARLHGSVRNGRIDFSQSKVDFVDEQGRPTDLDGPFWWNAKDIYITPDGRIKADVPCFPDPDITEKVLGPGVKRLSARVEDMVGILEKRIPSQSIGGQDIDLAQLTGGMGESLYTGQKPEKTVNNTPEKATDLGLGKFLNFAGATLSLKGQLRPGPLQLGEQITLDIAPGTRFSAEGPLRGLKAHIVANVKQMTARNDDTMLSSGAGTVELDFETTSAGSVTTVRALDVDRLNFKTNGGDKPHTLNIGKISVPEQGGRPIITTTSSKTGENGFTLDLPQLKLNNLKGAFQVEGADGKKSTVRIGPQSTTAGQATMNVNASLYYNNASSEFRFASTIDGLRAGVQHLGLLDAKDLDIRLRDTVIDGSGTLAFSSIGGKSSFELNAKPGTTWKLQSGIDEVLFGHDSKKGAVIDVSNKTTGALELKTLKLSSDELPVIDGSAKFAVTLDRMALPLGQGQFFEVRQGTEGTLSIDTLRWNQGDKSPTLKAVLRLKLGAKMVMEPGEIPGLEGGRVEIDAKTGQTSIALTLNMDKNGVFTGMGGLNIKGLEVLTQLSNSNTLVSPSVKLSNKPLGPVKRYAFKPVRKLVPPNVKPSTLPAPSAWKPPPLRLRPSDALSILGDTTFRAALPTREIPRTRLFSKDYTTTFFDDDMGFTFDLDVQKPAGDIKVVIKNSKGKISAASRITVKPPLKFLVNASILWPGDGVSTTNESIIVSGLTLVTDEDGTHHFKPDLQMSGNLSDTLKDLTAVFDYNAEDIVGKYAGEAIANSLFGEHGIPTKWKEAIRKLSEHQTALAQPIALPPEANTEADDFDWLLKSIKKDAIRLDVDTTIIGSKRLALGDGQFIRFGKGSTLSVQGTPDDMTIEGTAVLDDVQLGSKDSPALSMKNGRGKIRIRIKGKPTPTVEMTLSELDADTLKATTSIGGMTPEIADAMVRDGSITIFSSPDAPPTLSLDFPTIKARVAMHNSTPQGDVPPTHLEAQIEGSLSLDSTTGEIRGELEHLALLGKNMTRPNVHGGTNVMHKLSLDGAATLSTVNGRLKLVPRAEHGLTISADATLAHGERMQLNEGTAKTITFSTDGSFVEVRGVNANFSTLMRLRKPKNKPTQETGLIDIRSARLVDADFQITKTGVQTLGATGVRVNDLDSSITNLLNVGTDSSSMSIRQMDVRGSGWLAFTQEQGWRILADDQIIGGQERTSLHGHAVAYEANIALRSPAVDLNLQPATEMEFDMLEFQVKPGTLGKKVRLRRAIIDGEVDRGWLNLKKKRGPLSRVSIEKGTRIQTDFEYLDLSSGAYAEPSTPTPNGKPPANLRLRGIVRLEGKLLDDYKIEPHHLKFENENQGMLEVRKMGLDMAFRAVFGIDWNDGEFSIQSRTLSNGKAELEAAGIVEARRAFQGRMQNRKYEAKR